MMSHDKLKIEYESVLSQFDMEPIYTKLKTKTFEDLVYLKKSIIDSQNAKESYEMVLSFCDFSNNFSETLRCWRWISEIKKYQMEILRDLNKFFLFRQEHLTNYVFHLKNNTGLDDLYLDLLVKFEYLNLKDQFSKGQYLSKKWLLDNVKKTRNLCLLGGWTGILGKLSGKPFCVVEIDESCKDIVEYLGGEFVYSSAESYTNINNYDIIVNTSSEHMTANWFNGVQTGKHVAIQNNSEDSIYQHIGCYDSLLEFSKTYHMKKVYFQDSLILPTYTRHMKLGYK